MSAPAVPSRRVRVAVWAFLAAFVVCGAARIEVWPLTGWQLFSQARTQVQHGWVATIDTKGVELPLGDALPGSEYLSGRGAYRGLTQLLQRFERVPPARRAAICRAWHARAWDADRSGRAIRIYRTRTDVRDRRGDRGAPAVRTLRFVCHRDGGVEAVG